MHGRTTSVVLPALAVLGLIAVVAIAAGGSVSPGSATSRPPGHALVDAIFTLLLIALVAGGVLLVYGLMQRKAIAQELASGKYRRMTFLAYVLYFGVVIAFSYWRLAHWPVNPQDQRGTDPGAVGDPNVLPDGETARSYTPGISWVSVAVVLALVAAAALAYVSAERRARRVRIREPRLAEQLAEALDDALDDLRAESDPRRAVIAAYARMERILAASGLRRRESETPEEYLRRALDDLLQSSDAIERLTELYTQAKFSSHEIAPVMKEDAIGALEQVRDELRTPPGVARVPEPDGSPAGASAA